MDIDIQRGMARLAFAAFVVTFSGVFIFLGITTGFKTEALPITLVVPLICGVFAWGLVGIASWVLHGFLRIPEGRR